MTYLKQAGYDTISLYQLEAYLKNQINLPGKAIVLTFDDGLKSVYRYAYPVLKDYGFRATAFIISSRIKRHPQKWNPDSLQFMSVSELKQIQDVFDVQSHTHFLHRTDGNRQPILLSRSLHNIEFDFERSRRALSQFNPHVLYLSYPFGGYNQRAIQAAQDAGFHLAVTTVQGKVKPGITLYAEAAVYSAHRLDPDHGGSDSQQAGHGGGAVRKNGAQGARFSVMRPEPARLSPCAAGCCHLRNRRLSGGVGGRRRRSFAHRSR